MVERSQTGILGGTFDPPHLGHLILAEEARHQLGLEKVLWVPAGEPWRKARQDLSAAADRVELVRRAIAANDAFALSTIEVEREGPSYTVDTLSALREREPQAEFVLIMGSDALADLPNWREPEGLIEMARLAVAWREEGGGLLERVDAALPGVAGRVVWVEMPRIDISSTELRHRAREGAGLRYLVPDAVDRYIRERGLYSTAAGGA